MPSRAGFELNPKATTLGMPSRKLDFSDVDWADTDLFNGILWAQILHGHFVLAQHRIRGKFGGQFLLTQSILERSMDLSNFPPIRIEDLNAGMRRSSQPIDDWAGEDNGWYIYEGVRPGLRLHEQLRYSLPPGSYRLEPSSRAQYVDLIFMDADVMMDDDKVWEPRLLAIIDSLTRSEVRHAK